MFSDTIIPFIRMLRYAERLFPNMHTSLGSSHLYSFNTALTPLEVCLALLTASLPMLYRPTKTCYRYIRAVCKAGTFAPGPVAANIEDTARAAADARCSQVVRPPMPAAACGKAAKERYTDVELLSQLTTVAHYEDTSSVAGVRGGGEEVATESNKGVRRIRSVESDDTAVDEHDR